MLNTGDKVKILSGDSQGKVGKIKARHFNVIPSELNKLKAGVTLSGKDNETLYSVQIEKEKDILYFPEGSLEFILA